MSTIKCYSELITLPTFKERFEYLKLDGAVGTDTFGYSRYLNQMFYSSKEWKALRDYIIVRDDGCDLATPGFTLTGRILIHHINPITIEDLRTNAACVLDPENLIATCKRTHNAIHYGNEFNVPGEIAERKPGDTCPWK